VGTGFEITFDKAKAETFLRAFNRDEAVRRPSPGGWTAEDLLTLGGACLARVLPDSRRLNRGSFPAHPPERVEAANDDLRRLMEFAVRHQAGLAALLLTGGYDDSFEPVYRAFLTTEGGEEVARPLSGWKGEGE
jgi:hypothetical protein